MELFVTRNVMNVVIWKTSFEDMMKTSLFKRNRERGMRLIKKINI